MEVRAHNDFVHVHHTTIIRVYVVSFWQTTRAQYGTSKRPSMCRRVIIVDRHHLSQATTLTWSVLLAVAVLGSPTILLITA